MMGDKYGHDDTEEQSVTSEGDTKRNASSSMVADDACVTFESIESVYDDFDLEETVINVSIDSKVCLDDDVFEVTLEMGHDVGDKDTTAEFRSSCDNNDRLESSHSGAEIKSGDDVTFCHIVTRDTNGIVNRGVDMCQAVSNPVDPGFVNRGFSDLSPFLQFLHQIGKPLSVALSDIDGTSVTKVTGENTGNLKGEVVQNMRTEKISFLCKGRKIYLTYWHIGYPGSLRSVFRQYCYNNIYNKRCTVSLL